MKYENRKEVKELFSKIDKHEKELEHLQSYRESGTLKVIIVNGTQTINTIGVGDFEHQYSKLATSFIEDCSQDCRDRLSKIKDDLEKL